MIATRLLSSAIIGVGLSVAFLVMRPADSSAVIAGALFIIVELLSELIQAVLSGLNAQVRASILLVLQRVVPLTALTLPLIGLRADQLFLFITAEALVLSALVIVGLSLASRPSAFLALLRSSSGFWASTIAANGSSLEPATAGIVGSAEASAVLASGNRLIAPLNLVTITLLNVFVPRLTRLQGSNEQRRVFRKLLTVVCAYAIGLALLSPVIAELLALALGTEYQSAIPYYTAVVIAAGMSGVSQCFQALVYARGTPIVAATVVAGGAIAGILTVALVVSISTLRHLLFVPLVTQAVILCGFVVAWRLSERSRGGESEVVGV
jgi:O-antigen/teichoic acid export membrane protein